MILNAEELVWIEGMRIASRMAKNARAGRLEDDLKEIFRQSSTAGAEIEREARLRYAEMLVGAKDEAEANAKVLERAKKLKERAERENLAGEDMLIVEACIEHVSEQLRGREWVALALTYREPNPGLRLAPDLARALILSDSPRKAIEEYKNDVKLLQEAWPFDFKAKVISYFRDGKPKWGPEYITPLIESDIEWKSGEVRGRYIFYMLRYEIDTDVAEIKDLPEGFILNPHPEHEPFGAMIVTDSRGRMRAKHLYARTHWRVWHGPAEDFEETEDGKTKVTAVADSELLVLGHASLFVPKDAEKAYRDIEKMSPQLKELDNIGYRFVLEVELPEAKKYYEEGERYDIPVRYVMEKTDPKSDALLKPLR